MLGAMLTMVLGLAVTGAEPAPKCGCPEALDFLSAKVARNYAGFPDKVVMRVLDSSGRRAGRRPR